MIQRLFDKITGRHVRFIGVVAAAITAIVQRQYWYLAFLTVASLNWCFPVLKRFYAFENFADSKYWPTFVALGIACITGHDSKTLIGLTFMILDGIYFKDNY